MSTQQTSFADIGWDPRRWARRLDTRYEIQDRETGKWHKFGDLMRRSPRQMAAAKLCVKQMMRGGPVRMVVLKGRRGGMSSLFTCLGYDVVTSCEGFRGGVLAHKQDSTDLMFSMVNNYWKRTAPELRPQKRKHNGTRIEFGNRYRVDVEAGRKELDSVFECATAGGDNPFSGGDYRWVHVSEAGKMPGDNRRQTELLTSVVNAVPGQGPSVVVMEGTAQGADNLFHKTWLQAEKNVANGRIPEPGDWIPFFFGWQDDPLNRMEVSPDYRWSEWDPEDIARERKLVDRYWGGDYKAAATALRWRRYKIAEIGNDQNRFDEEFPDRPEVAFLRSGQPAFAPRLFGYLDDIACDPIEVYTTQLEENDEAIGASAIDGWRTGGLAATGW